jgi:hypothetical protein
VVLLTLVSNCTWEVLENLIKIKYLSSLFNPYLSFRFILFSFLVLYFIHSEKISIPIFLCFCWFPLLLRRLLSLNFLFFIVHGIQRFSNRCLEFHLWFRFLLIFGFIILVLSVFLSLSLSSPLSSFLSLIFFLSLSFLSWSFLSLSFYPYPFLSSLGGFSFSIFFCQCVITLFPHQKVYCAGHLYLQRLAYNLFLS